MKNSNKSFDAELIKRLRNYSEEPRMQLWQKIAASAEANRRPLATRRTGWILILSVIAIGGLYYLDKTKTNTFESTVLAGSLSSIVDDAGGTVNSDRTMIRDAARGKGNNTSVQITENKLIVAPDDVSLNQARLPI